MEILTSLSLICIFVLANFIEMTQVQQEYDDPSSKAYTELKREYNLLWIKRTLANRLPGSRIFILARSKRSCVNRCGEVRNDTQFCHCDRLCALYKDCCIDYWPACNITTKPFNRPTQALWQCVDVTYKKPSADSQILPSVAYMMITRCPKSNKTTNHSSPECLRPRADQTKLSDVIPVMGADGQSYVNRHCAKCNGINEVENIMFWGLNVSCKDDVNATTDLTYESEYLHRYCNWHFAPPNTTNFSASPCKLTTLCQRVVETPESTKLKDLIEKCKSYMQAVYSASNIYKNFHCAVCDGINISDVNLPVMHQISPSLTMFFDYNSLSDDDDPSQHTPEVTSPHDVIRSYVTIVGLSLSVACLSVVVITYAWFPKLRTVPGLVLLGLSLALISYQGLLLVSSLATSQATACKGVAVLLHFMILAAFTWMAIMSYDVAKTFVMKGKSSGRSSSSSAFRRYLIVAVAIPGVIVGLSFTLGETNAINVGYGESNNESCWIGTKLALILFFHIPVGILLLFNAVALILTILSIRKVSRLTKKVQKSVRSDSRGQNVKIYSKLSTVMGITWFLGFGVSYSVAISYLYIILNSLQGVLIFVTFVLNKRTINLWRYQRSTRGGTSSQTRLTGKSNRDKSLTTFASTNQLDKQNNSCEHGVTLSFSNIQQ